MKTEPSEIKQWTTNQVVLATLFVVCVFLTFLLIYRFRVVVFLFFIAMVIGTTIRPAVEWLYQRGISRPTGIILIYFFLAACLTGFLALTVPLIVDQVTQLSQNIPQLWLDFRGVLLESNNLLSINIGRSLPVNLFLLDRGSSTAQELIDQVGQTFYYAHLFLNGVVSVLVVFLLAYYWTQESNFLIRNILRLIPGSRRNNIREFIRVVEVKIGGYVRGQGILSLVVATAAFVAYALIGLPYVLVLALIAGLMELVPIFGPVLGAIPAGLVALSVDSSKVIWVAAATLIIQLAENAFLVPRIMNRSMGVNPILILLSLITFSSVFGFPGALLAIPLAAILQIIFERIYTANDPHRGPSAERMNIQKLFDRSQAIVQALQVTLFKDADSHSLSEHVRQETMSISQDLVNLLKRIKTEDDV